MSLFGAAPAPAPQQGFPQQQQQFGGGFGGQPMGGGFPQVGMWRSKTNKSYIS